MLLKDVPAGKILKAKIYRRGDAYRESNAIRLDVTVRESFSKGVILNRAKAPSGEWISLEGDFVVDVYYELPTKVEVWMNVSVKNYKDSKGAGYMFAYLGDSKVIQRRKYTRYKVGARSIIQMQNDPDSSFNGILGDVSLTGFSLEFDDRKACLDLTKTVIVHTKKDLTFTGKCVRVQPMRGYYVYGFKFIQDSLEVGSEVVSKLREN